MLLHAVGANICCKAFSKLNFFVIAVIYVPVIVLLFVQFHLCIVLSFCVSVLLFICLPVEVHLSSPQFIGGRPSFSRVILCLSG